MQNRPLNPCSLAVLTSHHDGRYCVLLHNSHCTHSAESPCILHARIKNVRRSAWRAPCCCVTWAFCNVCPAGSSLWESSVSQENTNLASWSKQATVIDQTQNHLNQALESRHCMPRLKNNEAAAVDPSRRCRAANYGWGGRPKILRGMSQGPQKTTTTTTTSNPNIAGGLVSRDVAFLHGFAACVCAYGTPGFKSEQTLLKLGQLGI